MKKFNQAKWDAIQQHKANLHQIYRSIDAEWDHANQQYGRAFSIFSTNYRDCRTALDVIQQDARTLSVSEIGAKLDRLRNDWPAMAEGFNVTTAFNGKQALIDLYRHMRERTKLADARDQAAQNQKNFGASFPVLNEFAGKHRQGDNSTFSAVSDQGPVNASYEIY